MQSIKEIYKTGAGPSSSHTLACQRACKLFVEEFGNLDKYKVELYGSLSLTGKGHWSDVVIKETLSYEKTDVLFKANWDESFPNGFYIYGYDLDNNSTFKWTVFSIGGGSIEIKEKKLGYNDEIYIEKNFDEIKNYLNLNNINLVEYVLKYEPTIKDYLKNILHAMIFSVERGISSEGVLPGKLKIKKCAKSLYEQSNIVSSDIEKMQLKLFAYAYGANEENASRNQVVTAPTLGACGVMAATMKYCFTNLKIPEDKLVEALMVAGVFGNVIKKNASISGAVGGCQAEIGSACAMASAALAYINDLSIEQIEYAAEIAIEHNLGLTCDPVGGYVIIPCIERNAMAVTRAFEATRLSKHLSKIKSNLISFDMVVDTMNYTGKKIAVELRETSMGGLAKEYIIES